jgi:glycosyltransferase involved in cell wall biosynthesis
MINNIEVAVIMPAYNAEMTLEKTILDLPEGVVDHIILCDDFSTDNTVSLAKSLGIEVIEHSENRGYGANQKTCYDAVLKTNAQIIAMIHPDYQYDPRALLAAASLIELGNCDFIMGSRIRSRQEALDGGMPVYKYISNRFLTSVENIGFGQNLADFHSGFRVYRRDVIEQIEYHKNSDDFIFDTEFLAQAVMKGFRLGDIPVPTRYFAEASSINFKRSLKYGIGCLAVVAKFLLHKSKLCKFKIFTCNDDLVDNKE